MEIREIRFNDHGFKGIEVKYYASEEKNGRSKVNEYKVKKRHPIHFGLERPVKELRYCLLEICEVVSDRMDKRDKDYLVGECEITGVWVEGNDFVLMGTKKVLGNKAYKLETPVVTSEDGYESYEGVMALLRTILDETKAYLEGEAKVEDSELVERWVRAGKEKEFNIEAFEALSSEQKKDFCQKVLEQSFGAVVLMNEEFEGDGNTEAVTGEFEIRTDEVEVAIPVKR